MSTKINEMRLCKWLVALVLAACVFALPQRASAVCDFWSESSNVLSPIDANNSVDANDFKATDDVEAAKFHTTGGTVSGTKTVAFGDSTTASGNNSTALGLRTEAKGAGSFAAGYSASASNTVIDANADGAVAMGYAGGTSSYGDISTSEGATGGVAIGYAEDANIYAQSRGSVAMGYADNGGEILAKSGNGCVAIGHSNGGLIRAEAGGHPGGSMAMGYAGTDANISAGTSSGFSCFALGYSDANLSATGYGSIAMGRAYSGDTKASSTGSCAVAIGDGVVADANDAFAIGTGFTNSTADRFQVGSGQADLEVWSGNAKVNGDLEVTGDVCIGKRVFYRSDGGQNRESYRVREVTGTALFRHDFYVPLNCKKVTSIKLIGHLDAAEQSGTKELDVYSDYGAIGEAYNNHSEEEQDVAVEMTVCNWCACDITSAFDDVAAGDFCGAKVDHDTSMKVQWMGILLEYCVAYSSD